MGLDVFLYDGETECPKVKSDKHPEHYFRKTYLHSSYNESGLNRVSRNLIGKDLYWIFEPPNDQYGFIPDLPAAKARAEQFLAELRAAVAANPFRVSTIAHNMFTGVTKVGEEDALKAFLEERAKWTNESDHFDSYSNRSGHFFKKEPLRVVAALHGVDALGMPAVHLVYADDDDLKWYVEASEVVIEFIDYATTLANPRLHWSS